MKGTSPVKKKTSSSYYNDTRANMEIFYKQRDINNSTMHLHMYIRRFPPLDQRHKSNPLLPPLFFPHFLPKTTPNKTVVAATNERQKEQQVLLLPSPSFPSLEVWRERRFLASSFPSPPSLSYSLLCMFFLLFLSGKDKNVPVRPAQIDRCDRPDVMLVLPGLSHHPDGKIFFCRCR